MSKIESTLQEAVTACAGGDLGRGQRLCRQVLEMRPGQFEALSMLGFIAARTGRMTEAADWLGRAIAAKPADVAAQSNLGFVLQQLGRLEEALACYDAALRLDPNASGTLSNRGYVLRLLNRFDEALESCDRAIALAPNFAQAHNNRGTVLQELSRFGEALESYRRAVQLDPNFARAHNNCGTALQRLGRQEEALASYELAVEIDPGFAEAHNNRGALLRELGRPEAAIACFDRAIAARQDYAEAYWNKSLALLHLGDYDRGWELFEWRWKQPRGASLRRTFPQPLWLGDEPIAGKTVLLHAEQGLGDTIQFCRYAKPLAELGARVVLQVPGPLLTLLATLDGVSQLVKEGGPLPSFDYHCPLMSLPYAMRTEVATIPAPRAYLAADPKKSREWKQRLGAKHGLRVGLVWSGGFPPNQPELRELHERRNMDPSLLAQLKNDRVEFYSLQKGEPAESDLARLEAAQWAGPQIIDFAGELRDFSDTAALAANLDLVITVDTSTAHLCGALGRPTWILNRFDSCWRWLHGHTDSPWYPTARIYAQQQPGDWVGVLEKVRADLERVALEGGALATEEAGGGFRGRA